MTTFHPGFRRRCIVCNKDISDKRRDAKTCSDNCRQQAKRHPKQPLSEQVSEAYNEAYTSMAVLGTLAREGGEEGAKAGRYLKTIIIQALYNLDDDALLRIHESMDSRIRDIKVSRV